MAAMTRRSTFKTLCKKLSLVGSFASINSHYRTYKINAKAFVLRKERSFLVLIIQDSYDSVPHCMFLSRHLSQFESVDSIEYSVLDLFNGVQTI